jgi:hypothetical protein
MSGLARGRMKPAAKKAAAKRKPAVKRRAAAKPAGKAGAKAAAAVERAKKAGALGPNGTDAQRAIRDAAIMAGLTAGHTQAEVAAELGVSVRTVQAVKASADKRPSLLEQVPMDILRELLASSRERIASFEAMAHAHAASNPSVAVAAKKGAMQAEERLVELLAALGKLPGNLETFRAESVLRQVADEMLDVMSGLKDGEVTVEEAHARWLAIVADSERPGSPRIEQAA